MEHGGHKTCAHDKDGSIKQVDQLILWWVPCLFAEFYHLYMQNVKLWYGRWSAWRPYESQKWWLQPTALNWWRWCLHHQNGRRSLNTWRSFCDVKFFFIHLLFSIFRWHKVQWRTSWHKVLKISLLLWFMLIRFPRGGFWIRNLLSFVLAFCCKKKKKFTFWPKNLLYYCIYYMICRCRYHS